MVKKQKTIRDFTIYMHTRRVIAVLLSSIAISFLVGTLLIVLSIAQPTDLNYWILILVVMGSYIITSSISTKIIAGPVNTIIDAITSISNETNTKQPPNPNTPKFQSTGLSRILNILYSLSAEKGENPDNAVLDSKEANLLHLALNEINTGIIILDKNYKIAFYNNSAPVNLDTSSRPRLNLLFEHGIGIKEWLGDTNKGAIRRKTVFHRVSNKIAGENGRKMYDCYVNFHKGSDAQIIIITVERTEDYLPVEEELDFIAFAAHELRGPITIIRGYLEVLNDELSDRTSDEEKVLFERLTVSANRLSGYINNILNTSRYDRRHLQLRLKEDSIRSIYSTIADDMRMRASSQNRLLNVNLPSDLPTVAADHSSISEVMSNLIDNAIKYSNPGGTIDISAKKEGDYVAVSVTDRGIGMPESVIKNLFRKFYRSHRSRETVAGTGMGLYIAKAIVDSHGGTISVKSIDGEGSTFTFTIPTYESIKNRLLSTDGTNVDIINEKNNNSDAFINNHAMFRG